MALSSNATLTVFASETFISLPVGAAVHIYRNGFVGKDPAGYAKAFVPGDVFVGIAKEEANNASGSAGDINVEIMADGDFEYALSSAAILDVGKPAFATADDAIALTGHPDAWVGTIVQRISSSKVRVHMREQFAKPPNGFGSTELLVTGTESFDATGADGATNGLEYVGGFALKSILGLGLLHNDAEDGGVKFSFDAVAEVALASLRNTNEVFPVDKGITFEALFVVSDKGDSNTLDIDWGLGTALTTNSEADADHADMAQLACFHLDGNSDNILAQSDDATTDVAAVDTTIDNDSTTDVAKWFKIIVRPTGATEFWINNARVLSSTTFTILSTAVVAPFVNMEKTSNDTTAEAILYYLRVAGGKVA